MKRSVALLSAAITAFSLVIMASVVYGYRVRAETPAAAPEPQQSAELITETSVQVPTISPVEAAAAAARYLDQTDAFSVELADYSGAQAYKVTFASGAVVYISPLGKVLASVPAPAQVTMSYVSKPARQGRRGDKGTGGGGGGGGGNQASAEHETEHESEGGD